MKITIIHAHWNNRGDEAALRALVDELRDHYEAAEIYVQILSKDVFQFPYKEEDVHLSNVRFPKRKNCLDYWLASITKGKIAIFDNTKEFVNLVKDSDIVLHGPGGPSIGDIYYHLEEGYLKRLDLVRAMGIKYAFFAPSMGPFNCQDAKRNRLRKRVLNNAEFIFLREATSASFLEQFGISKDKIKVSLDSAFQHYGDENKYSKQLEEYRELKSFIDSYEKIIGITITGLMWHPVHKNNEHLSSDIESTFTTFITELRQKGIGVVFIPQLFGEHHDKSLMAKYMQDNCFIVDDEHDCYFQQYLIGKLYAVVGMRYHSNIFSAKMGTPFISVSYEQKMSGFMDISGLKDYCININELSSEKLIETFDRLENNYDNYRQQLSEKKALWAREAHKTTDAVIRVLSK